MNQEDRDWIEVVAQLRHRVSQYEAKEPWLFRTIQVDDAVQESITRYLAKTAKHPNFISIALVPLLTKISHDFLIDQFRKTRREDLVDVMPLELSSQVSKPWLTIIIDQLIAASPKKDRPFWRTFRRLAEGLLTLPNQQVAEELKVTATDVVRFRERARRLIARTLGGPWH